MTDNNAALKNKFRKECRQIREKLGEDFRHLSDTAIIKQIENWKPFCNASVILTYMPIKAEVDLRMLFARFPEKNWVLPRILPENRSPDAVSPIFTRSDDSSRIWYARTAGRFTSNPTRGN